MKKIIFIPLFTFLFTHCMEPKQEMQITLGKIIKRQQSYETTFTIEAYCNNSSIGTIEYRKDYENGYIDTIHVIKSFQNNQIGTALFLKAMDHLYNMGALTVSWKAVKSIPFYTRFGARVEGEIEDETARMIFEFDKDGCPRKNYWKYKESQLRQL